MASETSKKASGTISSAADRAKELSQTVTDAAAGASAQAREHVSNVADAAGDLYSRAADRTRDAIGDMPSAAEAKAKAEKLALRGRQQIGKRVQRQPVEALLLAGAIGYLVGWAASRG